MTNWLERAKSEMSKGIGWVTADSDERDVTAVMAVSYPDKSENPGDSIGSNGSAQVTGFQEIEAVDPTLLSMTKEEETAIRAWLAHIEETDPATITAVLDKCLTDVDERKVLLQWAKEVPRPSAVDDDRRRCDQCVNLTERGLCLAARRGEINATRVHKPVRDLLQRCIGYMPKATDRDQRSGRERWPGLVKIQEAGNHVIT
ncbi:MAG: hypothetical protein EOO38_12335 [Cytophagaceae bacterium]|nr:MAG: hypothetical protein EOO38_12335 [Cytophagaceae bacterium]